MPTILESSSLSLSESPSIPSGRPSAADGFRFFARLLGIGCGLGIQWACMGDHTITPCTHINTII